ncbi:acetyl/propionyl/methylcrotonyl-CoA carboxylase subunit alpha [Ruania halotolerans]|uniref:acetyl/propionyl/methylcrotonyl-CoA carboxylase subunit alpha n=1 Tax=Ruania halotolerans TaxID=2897773 RepID=UPI001E36AF89|nr:biotin carboxylase N-terminal domain-containing protein [Ruania halotolerans]UFU05258.1 ATP-grasp domain-containing protein [Ruania halotolerans]
MSAVFSHVLIANRGEIAVRIARTLTRMGVRAVGVYSDADDGAPHVRAADAAYRIGPAKASESYLNVAAIISAARRGACEAVHPGYGFLSESTELARACEDAGLVFIGPGTGALEVMGSKILAKERVAAAGVPVIGGVAEDGTVSTGGDTTIEAASATRDHELLAAAAGLGVPLLVKPSAGGGGKGMHVVRDLADLPEALAAARRIAHAAFGDDRLLLERLVESPRHIEVQVLADQHGTVVSLGERECSLQRRHQKVIEEAPSPLLDEGTRERICAAAREVARSVDYRGAGTVEFLLPAGRPDDFAFMEMNTRLQVEHPVTEAITGVDLVEWQLRVAAGEPLDPGLGRSPAQGWAMEARIYAERPEADFLPAAGTAHVVHWPHGVRVDDALEPGTTVGTDYDPMLAKVIAHAATRDQALARLDRALAETVILGVHTNADYLRAVLARQEVAAGTADTTFLDRLELPEPEVDSGALIAAALTRHARTWTDDLWRRPSGWRLGPAEPVEYVFAGDNSRVQVSGPPTDARVVVSGSIDDPGRRAAIDGSGIPDVVDPCGHWLEIDGLMEKVWILEAQDHTWVRLTGRTTVLTARPRHVSTGARADPIGPQLRTPMPGTVVAVHVESGELVQSGDLVVTIEAMKMEHQIRARCAGIITVDVAVGHLVRADQMIGHVTGPESPQDSDGPSATIHKI